MDKFTKNRAGGSFAKSRASNNSAATRKTPGKKTGVMGKGKSHIKGRPEDSNAMDADGSCRTHLLFAGRGGDETSPTSGSPSILQAMFGGGTWGRRPGPSLPLDSRNPAQEAVRYRTTPDLEPFNRPIGKQVSFAGGGGGDPFPETEIRPERKPNSYNCDPPIQAALRTFGPIFPSASQPPPSSFSSVQPPTLQPVIPEREIYGKGLISDNKKPPMRRMLGTQPGQMSPRDSQNISTRNLSHLQESGVGIHDDLWSAGPQSTNISNDCFVIPQENLERFLPDGITLPSEPRHHPLINVLEVDDPKLVIIFHLMAPFTSITPHLESPLSAPLVLQRKLAEEELVRSKELQASQGFLLKNLEKDSEYPFINYFVIHKSNQEARKLFGDLRTQTYDAFCPTKVGYSCQHSFDLYDEVATIARPPVEPLSKRPLTDLTGYIICLYRVFKGDDGEKFERNWLFWTGARMLYKNLPKAVGLRRLTLHKSVANDEQVVYLLLVECTHFMDHIGEAANLLPILRARICGYTGIFRVAESF